jgi:thiamine-monophosphate kinase
VNHLPLGPGREFDRVRAIAAALGPQAASLGDDCAVIPVERGFLALSTDVSVEGVHFRRGWLTPAEIGWRAAAAALSDLAAEGAAADGILVALTVPANAGDGDVAEVMAGCGAAAASVGGMVWGGDLSAGPGWSIAVTSIGRVDRAVTRRGATPGSSLWVTGALGGARAALDAWLAGREPDAATRPRFAHPEPRVSAGRWLAAHGALAMLDLSDGLAADLPHLAAASGSAATVTLDAIPLALGVTDRRLAAEGGEDYELLAALPRGFDGAAECHAATGVVLTRIGEVNAGSGVAFTLAGQPVTLQGFQHFR